MATPFVLLYQLHFGNSQAAQEPDLTELKHDSYGYASAILN